MDQSKKKKMVYKFVTNFHKDKDQNMIQDIDNTYTYFYQIAAFADPNHGQYNLRKFYINGKNQILDVRLFWLSKKQYKQFKSSKKCNEYKAYDVYNLNTINYPSVYDIMTCKSDLLCHNNNYSGFASF